MTKLTALGASGARVEEPPLSTVPMEPPAKRPRLASTAYGALSERKMRDLETSLEVDHMILDYLLYQALDSCFSNRHSSMEDEPSPVQRSLLQVDEFMALFKMRYPRYKLDAEIRFRQQLLQFVVLFTQRLRRGSATPSQTSLKRLRDANSVRVREWVCNEPRIFTAALDTEPFHSQLPILPADLERNRTGVLRSFGLPVDETSGGPFYGTIASVSLLDLLPFFMKLCSSCFAMFDVELTTAWMELATELMLQACLEQYLVFGVSGTEAIEEAFAWGYRKKADGEFDAGESQVERMFQNEEGSAEVEGWQDSKQKALEQLFSVGEQGLCAHLVDLASSGHTALKCETLVTTFLQKLSRSIAEPVLLQLEVGRLDGMTEAETQAFVEECGLTDFIAVTTMLE